MTEFEDRLRTGLATLADEAPPSADPRTELHRRIGTRASRGRMPALVAAAAAVVVLGAVAVPIALERDQGGTGGVGTATTAPTHTSSRLPSDGSPKLIDAPFVLKARGAKLGVLLNFGQSVRGDEFCWELLNDDTAPASGGPTVCEPMPDLDEEIVVALSPTGPARELAAPAGLLARAEETLVFLGSPEVHRLRVTAAGGDGTELSVASESSQDLSYFVVDFEGPSSGFGYTAYDRDGNVLAEGTT